MPLVLPETERKIEELLVTIGRAAHEARLLVDHSGRAEDLEIERLAQEFARLDDDSQARFFVEVAKIMRAWPASAGMELQAYAIGSHLKHCECSTQAARDLVEGIAHGIAEGKHR